MSVFEWIAAAPGRYELVSGAPLVALCVLALCGVVSRRADAFLSGRLAAYAYLAVALIVLLCARWPTLFVRVPLNQDEAQALAQAITALHDPTPWRGFDGNTCGPLNTYVLMLPALFGQPLTFLTTRLIAIVLEFVGIAAIYACIAPFFGAVIARLAILPPVAFFALATQDHFVHYSGEHLSMTLGMLALAFLSAASVRRLSRGWLCAAGVATGMMPFAKLQSVPLAALSVAVTIAVIAPWRGSTMRHSVRALTAFLGGIVVPGIVILSWTAAGGALRDFWISYILSSRAYILAADQPVSFLTHTREFGPMFDALLGFTAFGAIALVAGYRHLPERQKAAFIATLVILIGAVWTIFAPKRGSLNYLLFAVFPAALAAGAALGIIADALPRNAMRAGTAVVAFAFAAACLLTESAFSRPPYPYLGALAAYERDVPDAVTALVHAHVRAGQRMAIWGWRPVYFVTTQTVMGTRDAITQYQYSGNFNPYLGYFRARYLRDLASRRPIAFLDAGSVSFDFDGKGRFGYDWWPELASVIDRDYRPAGTAEGVRLFLRRDGARG